ncbi:conserved hypothetical protein [Parafrankia sp. EAN1pec]|uniref:hypothetical protein n=1 Tax=Parafrankia sp. (strain EAN1pec) TaxID=298653 RepID=UPI00005427FB|nr:conserved hypothetical protein [Frankia sp. EAN1pec]
MTRSDDLTVLVGALRRDRRRDPRAGRREYSQAALELADRCERLLAAGSASAVAPVLRKAVDRMTGALMYMDDSSGIVGTDLRHMMTLYAHACADAPPDPTGLARWLAALSFDGPGWPEIRLVEFVPALGSQGLAALNAEVERRAATAEPGSWGQLVAARDLREQLAQVSGDVDRHVAVLAENLNSASQYQRIVVALRDAGRPAEAIDWAHRGLADHDGGPQADRLRDLLVDLEIDAGDLAAAVVIRRDDFERRPTANAYRALLDTGRRCAADTGLAAWATAVLRARVARQSAYADDLVAVLLAEGETDQAWEAGLHHAEVLSDRRLVELLELRRTSHPGDVLAPYRELIETRVLAAADKRRYRTAISLLRDLRETHLAIGDAAGFSAYIDHLRAEHRRRPTFIAHLDAAGL